MPRIRSFVLDSFAVIGFLENESFADQVESLLIEARDKSIDLHLHAIHLGEVYYIMLREQGENLADLAYSRINALPITIIENISENLLKKACYYKASFPVSYADAFAAALAEINNCPLLTGDPEFEPIEKAGSIQVDWLVDR